MIWGEAEEEEEEEDNESEYDGDSEDHLEDDIADESDAESLIESMFNDSDPDPELELENNDVQLGAGAALESDLSDCGGDNMDLDSDVENGDEEYFTADSGDEEVSLRVNQTIPTIPAILEAISILKRGLLRSSICQFPIS